MTYKKFDSEAFYKRLLIFGQESQTLVKQLPKTIYNQEYGSQLIRSSSSPGANYIEALEALGKKDFIHRLRICRKEIRESIHWLRLIKHSNSELKAVCNECERLIKEGQELVRFLTSSIITLEKKNS